MFTDYQDERKMQALYSNANDARIYIYDGIFYNRWELGTEYNDFRDKYGGTYLMLTDIDQNGYGGGQVKKIYLSGEFEDVLTAESVKGKFYGISNNNSCFTSKDSMKEAVESLGYFFKENEYRNTSGRFINTVYEIHSSDRKPKYMYSSSFEVFRFLYEVGDIETCLKYSDDSDVFQIVIDKEDIPDVSVEARAIQLKTIIGGL